jgi:hypothetical protein
MIAAQARIIWGANLIPSGAACGGDEPPADRHVRARRPIVEATEGSDGGALATPGGGRCGACGVDVRPPSDSGFSEQKTRDGFLRAGS